jgi:hypothetical protein
MIATVKSNHRLKTVLRAAAAGVLAAVLALWLATGAHRGWTRTQITEMQRDEITGIEFPTYRRGFVAGVDFLAAGLGVAAALAGASLLPLGRRESPA